jgi:hypothetical protein
MLYVELVASPPTSHQLKTNNKDEGNNLKKESVVVTSYITITSHISIQNDSTK